MSILVDDIPRICVSLPEMLTVLVAIQILTRLDGTILPTINARATLLAGVVVPFEGVSVAEVDAAMSLCVIADPLPLEDAALEK